MNESRILLALGGFFVGLGVWEFWATLGRQRIARTTQLHICDSQEIGTRSEEHPGNIIAIQPMWFDEDFATGERFAAKINGYLQAIADKGWMTDRSVIVWPEYIGTWLVTANSMPQIFACGNLTLAMLLLIVGNLRRFLKAKSHALGRSRTTDALFRMNSSSVARIFDETFRAAAVHHGVTIVAGSLVLPGAQVVDGRLAIDEKAPLQNITAVYLPDGQVSPKLVRKVFPIESELTFTACGRLDEDLPIFDTPVGRLAVLICADSWFPQSFEQLNKHAPLDAVLLLSYAETDDDWKQRWAGYSTDGATPNDVDLKDIQTISMQTAWERYSLPGRIGACGAPLGISVYSRGDFWGMGSDGHSMVSLRQPDGSYRLWHAPHVDGAALLCVWR